MLFEDESLLAPILLFQKFEFRPKPISKIGKNSKVQESQFKGVVQKFKSFQMFNQGRSMVL